MSPHQGRGHDQSISRCYALPSGLRRRAVRPRGVLTKTATVHAAAWKRLFDRFLAQWAATPGQRSSPVTSMPIDPQLPQELERLDMRIRYREHSLDLRLTRAALTVRGRERGAAPIRLGIKNEVYEFAGGSTRVFQLS